MGLNLLQYKAKYGNRFLNMDNIQYIVNKGDQIGVRMADDLYTVINKVEGDKDNYAELMSYLQYKFIQVTDGWVNIDFVTHIYLGEPDNTYLVFEMVDSSLIMNGVSNEGSPVFLNEGGL